MKKPQSDQKIKVLIVDDHPVVLKGIRSYLSGERSNINVVGEAYDGNDAVTKTLDLKPDVVLMDFSMPGLDGAEAVKLIKEKRPETRILVFTMYDEREIVLKIIQAGAQGYLLKSAFHKELLQAIEAIHKGDIYLGTDVAKILLNEYLNKGSRGAGEPDSKILTRRENEILALIAEGLRNKAIAVKLGVSIRTVEAHRDRIRKKLGISSPAGLTKYAIEHNITFGVS